VLQEVFTKVSGKIIKNTERAKRHTLKVQFKKDNSKMGRRMGQVSIR